MTDAVRLKWLLSESDVRAGEAAEKLPLLSVSISWGVRRREASDTTTRAASEDLSNYKVCRAGNLVINRMRAFQGALGIAGEDGIVSPDYAVLQVAPEVDARWLNYFLTSEATVAAMSSLVRGIGGTEAGNVRTPRLNISDLLSMTAPLEPVTQQRAIADYLDRETARIDMLIEEQQRLIGMLRERRWAVVERGVALLDWSTPFKAVAVLIQTGPFGSQLKSDEYEDGGMPVINPSHLVAGEIVPDSRIAISFDKARELARHALKEGDLIAARRGELGRCAVVRASSSGFLCGTGSALIRLNVDVIDPAFAAIVFSSRRNRDALALASVGSTMDNLNSDIIGSLRVPVPALDEQCRLVAQLNEATAKIDSLIVETERFIELSRERRSALITAAVTGQIDVREAT
ncbi:restriction endonuclease subunit S [Nonomuraea sp. CA-143628]|uniref:restriction endonuclease subunit S n=1 Tax=Nonomuraea sp. CA-143628 TaxID=3239997 RepID=UPI003D8C0FBD